MTTYRIGRGTDSDIIVEHASVSRHHADLEAMDDGRFVLRDAGSSNGTMIERDGEWEPADGDEVDPATTIRLGRKVITVAELLALREELAEVPVDDGPLRPPDPVAYEKMTEAPVEAPTKIISDSTGIPKWLIPSAAIGGGGVLILIVVAVLLLGPLRGAASGDFVQACMSHGTSKTVCECWAGELRSRLTTQEFNEVTESVAKRDWRTAMPPALRATFNGLQPAVQARCGVLL